MTTKAPEHENGVSTMTTDKSADPAKAGKLAQEIVAILVNEDSVTRQRAIQAAMMLLGEIVPQSINGQSNPPRDAGGDHHADLESFFNRDGEMRPADYAHLCAAYHFSQFGAAPFSTTEIRVIATDAGVVVPDRLDMTFRKASKKGKKLFQSAGKGSFKPTATGSVEFQERWAVKPGRKAKAPPTAKGDGSTDAKA
jgi:hypothetical protein